MIMKKDLYRAIDQHCKNCIYDPQVAGAWREQVEKCTVKACSLFIFRPLSSGKKRLADDGNTKPFPHKVDAQESATTA